MIANRTALLQEKLVKIVEVWNEIQGEVGAPKYAPGLIEGEERSSAFEK